MGIRDVETREIGVVGVGSSCSFGDLAVGGAWLLTSWGFIGLKCSNCFLGRSKTCFSSKKESAKKRNRSGKLSL